jgi:hypothetical protein
VRPTKMKLLPAIVLSLGALASNVGCGTVRETHYFRSQSPSSAFPNYYRVQITADAGATKVRYLSGYFDEKAVEQYFAEFAQPERFPMPGEAKAHSGDGPEPANGNNLQPIDPKLDERSLVLILSTNVDDVAAQMGALAENIQVQSALTGIVNKEELAAARQQAAELDTDRKQARELHYIATAVSSKLAAGAADAEKNAEVLRLVNELARYLGSNEHFTDLDKAKAWLDANHSRIIEEMEARDE